MTDTEIINALEALAQEYFDTKINSGFDMQIGRAVVTVHRPAPVHVPSSKAPIQVGRLDLRAALRIGLQPHLVRLVTRELTK